MLVGAETVSGVMNDCCSEMKCGVGAGETFLRRKKKQKNAQNTQDVLLLERIELEEGGVC